MNTRIALMPGKTQTMSVDGYGTNRGGPLGTQLSLSYKHRNLFRTMGSIKASITFGFEAQQRSPEAPPEVMPRPVPPPAAACSTPSRSVPTSPSGFPSSWCRSPATNSPAVRPRTSLFMLYNYQQRPDYTRTLARLSFGYEWNESLTKTWGIFPFNVNVIELPYVSPDFSDYLHEANDPVLTDSYTDHLIVGGGYNTPTTRRRATEVNGTTCTTGSISNRAEICCYASTRRSMHRETRDTSGTEFYTLLECATRIS